MNTGRTIFSQVVDYLPLHEFRKCVKRYLGHYKVQSFSCLDQYQYTAFIKIITAKISFLSSTQLSISMMNRQLNMMSPEFPTDIVPDEILTP